MLDTTKIRAISLDLDDTLWPIWPIIEKAEAALDTWLLTNAAATRELLRDVEKRQAIRQKIEQDNPQLAHDLASLRREAIRSALLCAGDDESLADAAFDVFMNMRNEVELYEDSLESLQYLAGRFPLIAVSNGNADLGRIGLSHLFRGALAAGKFGVGKPDIRIFQAAADVVGVPLENILHVGDDASLDVLGAHAAGMKTAWVNRGDHSWTHEVAPDLQVTNLHELCALFKQQP
ncbi:HAD family hydrolase [Ottowia thiooxydans]|uniref:HAD family hydrolase n=1 Tax=Ottowia thiooxydans TaxID=219182 RepID=UPI000428AFEB|nr:HAD-IA family hydrolase [Ottowia thiooxydans]